MATSRWDSHSGGRRGVKCSQSGLGGTGLPTPHLSSFITSSCLLGNHVYCHTGEDLRTHRQHKRLRPVSAPDAGHGEPRALCESEAGSHRVGTFSVTALPGAIPRALAQRGWTPVLLPPWSPSPQVTPHRCPTLLSLQGLAPLELPASAPSPRCHEGLLPSSGRAFPGHTFTAWAFLLPLLTICTQIRLN